ncbi:MAG: GxxExxY protein [Bacteroidales bacterium]|nr:GxxExxY protein [Bacteroidales bacterium]MDD3666685.1 GxxExxY protein [Bacteroidales bacterium]
MQTNLNVIFTSILDKAYAVHKVLGPGLLESVYEKCLEYELIQAGFYVKTQVPVPMKYKEVSFDIGFRIDLIVNDLVLVELKSVEEIIPLHLAQTLTYLKMADLRLGMLINFNTRMLKGQVKRVVNNYEE